MQAVGIRDLKAKLSHYVRLAKTGEVVLVTEHGRVVAALGPPIAMTQEMPGLQGLVARGLMAPGVPPAQRKRGTYARTGLKLPEGTASAILDELRADR